MRQPEHQPVAAIASFGSLPLAAATHTFGVELAVSVRYASCGGSGFRSATTSAPALPAVANAANNRNSALGTIAAQPGILALNTAPQPTLCFTVL